MPLQDNINNTKDHLYMVTAKPANFIPRALSVSQLEKYVLFFKNANCIPIHKYKYQFALHNHISSDLLLFLVPMQIDYYVGKRLQDKS